jgi:hypothetical protein
MHNSFKKFIFFISILIYFIFKTSVYLVGILFNINIIIADARNHEPEMTIFILFTH